MKRKHLYIYLFLIIGLKGFCQKLLSENFAFNNKQVNYYFKSFRNEKKGHFYVIINHKESKEKIIECFQNSKKLKSKIFFLKIPPEINNQEDKEKLILEFITSILRRKLIDSKMEIISDFNYFKLYEETRNKSNNRYKFTYLNPINSLLLLKENEEICKKIE